MKGVENLNLGDKANRHHRRAMLKDPNLAAPVPGGAKVLSNGHLRVVVPLVDNTVAAYGVAFVTECHFRREEPSPRLKAYGAGSIGEAMATMSPSDRAKGHIDAALNILAAIEKRAVYLDSHDTQKIAAE